MFNNWYVLKFTCRTEAERPQTGFTAYEQFSEAKNLFDQLQMSYRLDRPLRLKDGQRITVTGAWLFEVFKFSQAEALEAIDTGKASLMYHAEGVDIDLKKAVRTERVSSG